MTNPTEKTMKPHCMYVFTVKGFGHVACSLKKGHASNYHEFSFPTWTARHWPAKRCYFTTVDGARLPRKCI